MIRKIVLVALALVASALYVNSAKAVILTAPDVLNPGGTVSPLPDGASGDGANGYPFTIVSGFPKTYNFDFSAQGGPTGQLFENVVYYSNVVIPAHPYGDGRMFDFRFTLTAGTVTQFGVFGYEPFDTAIKQCDFVGCLHVTSGATGASSASRSANGDEILFSFSNLSGSGAPGTSNHTGNFQIFTNAGEVIDPLGGFYDANGDLFTLDIAGPAVPEPSTWAMMLLGFAGLGYMGFRQRKRMTQPEMALHN